MNVPGWFRLLARNHFAIAPIRWAMAAIISLFAPVNIFFALLQRFRLGRAIDETKLADDPVFVIGHWRSGTTYLHELLVRDERFTYPNTYDVFAGPLPGIRAGDQAVGKVPAAEDPPHG